MVLEFSDLGGDIHLIRLMGRLDIIGTGEIEIRFAGYCAVNNCRVLVDLSGVDFLASIGIRLLVMNAKAVANRGGRMFIISPSADVKNVLDLSGIVPIIPIYDSLDAAQAASLTA